MGESHEGGGEEKRGEGECDSDDGVDVGVGVAQNSSGTLSVQEFMDLPGLKANPLLERILDVFDENQDGEVQFTEFISALSIFNTHGAEDAKLRCL